METVLQDMVRWVIGFCLASALYVAVSLWLIRRWRRRRSEQNRDAAPTAADSPPHGVPDLASSLDSTNDKNQP